MDEINPKHYNKHKIQPIDVIEDWDLSYALGNVVKYLCRYRDKGGVTDLKKAQWYLNRCINSLTPNESIDVPKEGTKPYVPDYGGVKPLGEWKCIAEQGKFVDPKEEHDKPTTRGAYVESDAVVCTGQEKPRCFITTGDGTTCKILDGMG